MTRAQRRPFSTVQKEAGKRRAAQGKREQHELEEAMLEEAVGVTTLQRELAAAEPRAAAAAELERMRGGVMVETTRALALAAPQHSPPTAPPQGTPPGFRSRGGYGMVGVRYTRGTMSLIMSNLLIMNHYERITFIVKKTNYELTMRLIVATMSSL